MENFEWKLKDYIASNNIKAEHLSLDKSCHSVEEAAEAVVDPKVTELDFVYTGGGSPYSLVRIRVDELLKVNQGTVVRVRK
ncbi:hypothetical protein T458_18790 [Brevibacillus panacihumi W25]|uniref:YbaK/aminoacyl-tRNA synthetase-associated domain-containing protein n=1 Tax=Brevibacillus panacihumi W25 TaxID=1408254 RepID=V6M5L0_9BACL|nr:hypothetical protein [Brevibacillus panacihumi]EST53859.1 hypothetical protein T458_18790 [Brevibacillus panacihumi W25]